MTKAANYLTPLVGSEVSEKEFDRNLLYGTLAVSVGDSRSNGCDSCLDSATRRNREVDLGCEKPSSRVAR